VPLDLHIEGGKAADNSALRRDIATATGKIVPGVMVTRIRWLHNAKEREKRRKAGKNRGTIIVCLPTEAMQWEVVKKGIVIRALHCEARLYSHGNQVKQASTVTSGATPRPRAANRRDAANARAPTRRKTAQGRG
jgi:hypothetical protein